MKPLSEMTLRGLVEDFRRATEKTARCQDDNPVILTGYVLGMIAELECRLPEIEAAVELAAALADQPHLRIVEDDELRRQAFKFYGESPKYSYESCQSLIDAYSAARRADAKGD